jgi:hypothetical protein
MLESAEELSPNPIETEILCNQCTAVLPVQQGSLIAICDYCGATNAVDKSQAVLHYVVRETLREDAAQAALRRWMGGNATVKNLDAKAVIKKASLQLWPLWLVRTAVQGSEKVFINPGAAVPIINLSQLTIPAADLEPFDYTLTAEAIAPTVPVNAVKNWLQDNHQIAPSTIKEISLVHLPVYLFEYAFQERPYTAVVDAATGKVIADRYPSKQEVPYQTIGGIGCLLYFLAALVPPIAYAAGGIVGLGGGILLYAIVAIIVAIPMFGIAAYISAKV